MSLSNHEKMDILLNQLQLPDEVIEGPFRNSELHKVIVYKSRKLWHFHLKVENTLPFEIYHLFYKKMQINFQHIAKVKLTLHTKEKQCSDTELLYYWKYFISQISNLMPTEAYIQEENPHIEDSTITINVYTEAEGASLKRKLDERFQRFCDEVGLKKYMFKFNVYTEIDTLVSYSKQLFTEDNIYM